MSLAPNGVGRRSAILAARGQKVREAMAASGVDALLLSVGADLPWLCGYAAMPLERLTMLVFPLDGPATLVVPELEAPRVELHDALFSLRPWGETTDPVALVAQLVGGRQAVAVSDRTWATFVLALQRELSDRQWRAASSIVAPLRAVKDDAEVAALAAASEAADRVAAQLLEGVIPLFGRTEAEVSADIGRRLLEEGHDRVNFAIVGSGPNSASPHHDAGARRIEAGDLVVCDFGGTMAGYCSDMTRTVVAGGVDPDPGAAEIHSVVEQAQAAGVAAATVGTPCQDVDRASRRVICDASFGEYFIHRTGHGIGLEEHEDPYLVSGNLQPLLVGHAFSIEPGVYLPGRYGVRIEDIVVAGTDGPRVLNRAPRNLIVVDA